MKEHIKAATLATLVIGLLIFILYPAVSFWFDTWEQKYLITCPIKVRGMTSDDNKPVAVLTYPTEGFVKCADGNMVYTLKAY